MMVVVGMWLKERVVVNSGNDGGGRDVAEGESCCELRG
jgi:hypothetical protein